MGAEYSQEDYDRFALDYYQTALQHPCLLPDIGIDESLLKYSGTDSNAQLVAYSTELVNKVPDYINNLGSSLGALTVIPNAVGIGALVLSMIMEISMLSRTESTETPYSMLQRVFGEEKASSVRDTMSEYVKRHQTFINNDQRLLEELRRLEAQLSNHLTILRNSLLHDGQMSTRGFKIWVNGASFHLQMLIHEARLNVQTGKPASDHQTAINSAISVYLQHLDNLMEKYKTYKSSTTEITIERHYSGSYLASMMTEECVIRNSERDVGCRVIYKDRKPCEGSELKESYVNHVFSKYEPVKGLKSHFSNIKNNLTSLINLHGAFTLPTTTT